MSYARMGPDSDVYVFLSIQGTLDCCACRLNDGSSRSFKSTDDMVAHLEQHTHAGHLVPDRTIPRLLENAVANDLYMSKGVEVGLGD
jgi:hypothetical protein